eukprot:4938194-Prorocentrum_lima.AAC.1
MCSVIVEVARSGVNQNETMCLLQLLVDQQIASRQWLACFDSCESFGQVLILRLHRLLRHCTEAR